MFSPALYFDSSQSGSPLRLAIEVPILILKSYPCEKLVNETSDKKRRTGMVFIIFIVHF